MTDRGCTSPLAVLAAADACHVAGCRYHLAEDVEGHKCSLLYAERDGMTLDEVAALLGVSRERVRQIEVEAFSRRPVKALLRRLGLEPDNFKRAEAP